MIRSLKRLDDVRLATLVGGGDTAAFEVLYDRHHAPLLAFCRHMLGSREDGEDALQQTFLRAHAALAKGQPPAAVRAWLYAIARNRCLTLLSARRNVPVPAELVESGADDLAENVQRRAELRELVADLGRLPEDQRAALVLSEIDDLSHAEIAAVLGCPTKKVKALAFQAREALLADREARCTPCTQIRGQLETANGNALRRASLRRHLGQCAPCDAYRLALSGRRGRLGALLPVAPTAGLKAAVLGGLWGGESAAAAVGGGAAAVAGGAAVKTVLAKVAVTAAVAGAGVTGGAAVVHEPEPVRAPAAPVTTVARAAVEPGKPEARATPPATTPASTGVAPAVAPRIRRAVPGRVLRPRARVRRALRAQVRPGLRATVRARRRALRAQVRPRLRAAVRAQRRALRAQARPRLRTTARVRPRTAVRPRRAIRRLERRRRTPPPAPTATPSPTSTAVPTATPVATAEPTPSPAPTETVTDQPG